MGRTIQDPQMADDHICSECDASFATERKLERHMRKAHNKTPTSTRTKIGVAVVAVLIVGLGAALFLTGQGSAPTTKAEGLAKLGADDDPMLGNASASVAVVEFSTPRCPSCRAFHQNQLPQIKSSYLDNGKASFHYSQFVLGYAYDKPGGIAQECAFRHEGDAGFWTLTDTLYAEQGRWDADNTADRLRTLADQEGWDADPIVTCYENRETEDAYQADLDAGDRNGVSGTPSFFVVGHDGQITAASAGDLESTIQDELARAEG